MESFSQPLLTVASVKQWHSEQWHGSCLELEGAKCRIGLLPTAQRCIVFGPTTLVVPGAARGPRKEAAYLQPRDWPDAFFVAHLVCPLAAARAPARIPRRPFRSAQATGTMFRRTGHTDDRRRRVLTEEVVSSAAGRSATSARSNTPVEASAGAYADAARLENHRRVSDFVPRRLSVVTLLAALGAAAIGGLIALHHVASVSTPGSIATALDLRQYGSVASWLSAMLTMWTAAASLLVYSLRRHKQSDYHGRYRIWLWTALAALGMSLCSAAPVHQFFAEQLAARTGWHLPGGTLLFWLLPLGSLLAVVLLRLVLDVRGSRLALTALALAVVAHLAGLVLLHTGHTAWSPTVTVMAGVGSQLAANLLLLVSITLFARHVLLDIEGRLPRREKPAVPVTKAASDSKTSSETGQRKIDPAHATPPAPTARSEATEKIVSRRHREEADEEEQWYDSTRGNDRKGVRKSGRVEDDDETGDEDADDSLGGQKLSKAERKRLRRLKAQQRESEFN